MINFNITQTLFQKYRSYKDMYKDVYIIMYKDITSVHK